MPIGNRATQGFLRQVEIEFFHGQNRQNYNIDAVFFHITSGWRAKRASHEQFTKDSSNFTENPSVAGHRVVTSVPSGISELISFTATVVSSTLQNYRVLLLDHEEQYGVFLPRFLGHFSFRKKRISSTIREILIQTSVSTPYRTE